LVWFGFLPLPLPLQLFAHTMFDVVVDDKIQFFGGEAVMLG